MGPARAESSATRHSIFIGYRRDDTADAAGRIFDNLERAFGHERVFKDVDSISVRFEDEAVGGVADSRGDICERLLAL